MAWMLALGLPNAAWALWSAEPTGNLETIPLPVTAPPATDTRKIPLGYTPPASIQETNPPDDKGDETPLSRRLDAGLASEIIEIPLGDKDAAMVGGTFTRVDKNLLDGGRKTDSEVNKKAAATGAATDTPIPSPASSWLMLFALPALLMSRNRRRG